MQRIDSLNPYIGLSDASYVFYGLVYDALTCIGNDLETVPNLAKEWWAVPLSDPEMVGMPYGSVWQYNLSTDAFWVDGEPFTADDVVFNMNLNAQNFDYMWAYQPYSYFMNDAVKVNEGVVRIRFWDRVSGEPIPAANAPSLSIPMLPKHLLESKSPMEIGFNWTGVFTDVESPGMPIVGTGPFMATPNITSEWIAGNEINLVRNPICHWASDYGKQIRYDKLTMKFFDDSTSMVLALENGEIDAAALPPQAYESVKDDIALGLVDNITTYDGPKVTQYWTEIGFCMNNGGPNPSRLDPLIRQALHMATNKTWIVQNYYLGLADEGSTLIAPIDSFWHYEPLSSEKFKYNLSAAAALLEASGYVDVDMDGLREATASSRAVQEGWVAEDTNLQYTMLVRREYPEEKDIAQYLEAQWATIGVDVNYLIVDEAALSTMVYSYNYDTVIWYWSGDVDPNYLLFTQTKTAWNGWSDNRYFNQAYEDNYTLSVTTLDNANRKVYVDNCQKIHYADSAYIIMAYTYQTYAWRNDTFTGWGDWSADPGRSLDNYWTGNPLFFDLVPSQGGVGNSVPILSTLFVSPNPVLPNATALLTVVARDWDADALSFYIEFGDGYGAIASGMNTTDLQSANFTHSYELPGMYNVTVWVNDSYPAEGHNVSRTYDYRVLVGPLDWLVASIDPSPVVMAVRESELLFANLTWNGVGLEGLGIMTYLWSVDPPSIGSFNYRARQYVTFTAGSSPGIGNISCRIIYYDIEANVNASLMITPAVLGQVVVTPASVTMKCNVSRGFTAYAYDTSGYLMEDVMFNWTFEGLEAGEYLLNATAGPSVEFTGFVEGFAWLNATATVGAVTRTGSSQISLFWSLPGRSVSYQWYDMFSVPFGDWWHKRRNVGGIEEPLTSTYPYLFAYHLPPPGNSYYYANMRLNVTGSNMWELNMNERPEFLPMFGITRGGTAVIDWYLNYLTTDELERHNLNASLDDGWWVGLNGTVTLDKEAAMTVMNLTEAGYYDFDTWWAANDDVFRGKYASWLQSEANVRLDIYPAYDYVLVLGSFALNAAKAGDNIVLTYDIVSWGMEVLMTRWMHEAFMPTEWYFEDMSFDATIGPDKSDIDVRTAVDYAVYAWETALAPGSSSSGEPCWVWEGMLQDYIQSSLFHPTSDFDPYVGKTKMNLAPGSALHGLYASYGYTPGAWNLSDGEQLTFSWPSDVVQFKRHVGPGSATNESGQMILSSSEPMDTDLPGNVAIYDAARTIIFTGPLDVWTWSKNQTVHQNLSSEWQRVGFMPRGMPYLEFKMDSNTPPRANVSFTPSSGDVMTVFEFNASMSYDLEDRLSSLQVRWDWDNDGTWDTVWSSDKTVYHQFSTAGTYMVKLEIKDSGGMTNVTYVRVDVAEVIPEFSSLVIPVVLMVFIAIFISGTRSRKRRS